MKFSFVIAVALCSVSLLGAHAAQPPFFNALECDLCKTIIHFANEAVSNNKTLEDVEDIAEFVCDLNHGGGGYHCQGAWQCKDMCTGAVGEFAPVIFAVAKAKTLDPEVDCVKLKFCDNSSLPASAWGAPSTHVEASAKRAATQARKATLIPAKRFPRDYGDRPIMRILQVTDIHFDPLYQPGSWTDCGLPLCCRPPDGPAPAHNVTAGYYGDYNCDTSPALLHLMLETAAQLDPDLIFLTGDDPPHNVWRQSQEFNTGVGINVTQQFASAFPNTPTIPCLGNHNGFPINQFKQDPSEDRDWLYNPLADAYAKAGWLDDAARNSFRQAGFYTIKLQQHANMRAIVLNTNFHTGGNLWNLLGGNDIAGMIAFLNATLAEAAANGESVFILGHHPPLAVSDDYSVFFDAVYQNYSHIIKGIFFGHSHTDYFRLSIANDTGVAMGISYVPTSVTPDGGRNPSFRIYEADARTGELLDYVQYRLDLAGQELINNVNKSAHAFFFEAYRATVEYNMTSIAPSEWLKVVKRMEPNTDEGNALFRKWLINFNSGHSNGDFSPGQKTSMICDMLSGSTAARAACHYSAGVPYFMHFDDH